MIEADKDFTGNFNGKGYTIKGLYINNSNRQQSLFGNVTGRIKNLTVEGEIIVSGAKLPKAAGFVSNLGNKGIIENCINRVNITVTGTNSYYVGGIVGDCLAQASIENCENYGTISGTLAVGGIVGTAQTNSTIRNCYSTSNIDATTSTKGSILGNNENGNLVTLENCYYLNTVGIGGVAGTDDENTKATLEDDMKKSSFANSLGGAFKYDSKKINGGYPLLSWQ